MSELLRLASGDGARLRAIRLRALQDAPDAFGRTLVEEEPQPPESWEGRLADPRVAHYVVTSGGADLGLVCGAPWRDRPGVLGLFAMWVAPEARGTGAGAQLVEAVIEWARTGGYERVVLDVADENAAAIALYERHGFVTNGTTGTLPPPREHIREHERELWLAR